MNRFLLVALPFLIAGCVVETHSRVHRVRSQPVAIVESAAPPAAPVVIDVPPPPPPAPPMMMTAPSGPPPPPPQIVVAAPPPRVVIVERPPLPDGEIVVVYEDLFGRRPSERELWEWRQRTRQRPYATVDVRNELRQSAEFRSLAPETIIRRAYRDYLGREPDPEGLRYYRRRMIDEGWTAGQVRQSIAHREDRGRPPADRRSDENAARRGPPGNDRREPPARVVEEREAHSPDAIIERAYDDLLERKPDPAGRDRYRRMLQQGMSEADLRAKIKQSEEYRVSLPDSKTTRAYREVLGRNPDPVGLEGYRHKLVDSGWTEEDVKNDLRRTAEYRNRHP
jgi:hypothetical protein